MTDHPKDTIQFESSEFSKTNLNEKREGYKYKVHLGSKRYKQQYESYCVNNGFPTVRHDTIRLVVTLVVQNSSHVFQLDVKSTFLHSHLKKTKYFEQPLTYVWRGHEHNVYMLKKYIYGLKQALGAWNCWIVITF